MIKKLLIPFILVFFLGLSSLFPFSIKGFNLYITNDFIAKYNDLANEKGQFYETLSIFSNYKKFSLGLILRANNFYQQTPNISFEKPEFDIYRKFVQYSSKYFKVNFGDFYSVIGRGMVFSVQKNEAVFRERTIFGGDIQYHRGNLSIRAIGGRLKDETNRREWLIGGGEISYQFIKSHRLGLHFSYVDDADSNGFIGERLTYSAALKGDKIFNNFSYYGEFALMQFPVANFDDGYGIYANIAFNKSPLNGFIEFKKYVNFNNEINNPPTADREDEFPITTDTTGVRIYGQYSIFDPDITLFINYGRYKEYDKTGDHYYAGFNIEDLWDRLNLSVTYGFRNVLYPQHRLDANLLYQITDVLSVEISLKDKSYRDSSLAFSEQDQNLQISYSPYISAYFLHQYSFNKIIDLNHFFSGGIKVHPSSSMIIELSGGTIRGGQVCSGGQCFFMPPFKGFKVSVFNIFK